MIAYYRHKTNWDFDASKPRSNTTTNSTVELEETNNYLAQRSNTNDAVGAVSIPIIPKFSQQDAVRVATIPEYSLHTKHKYVSTIWDEWYGQEAFSPDESPKFHSGGINELESKYKATWRKQMSAGEAKRFSRHKSIITNVNYLFSRSGKTLGDVITFLDQKCDEDNIHSVTLTQQYLHKKKQVLFDELSPHYGINQQMRN